MNIEIRKEVLTTKIINLSLEEFIKNKYCVFIKYLNNEVLFYVQENDITAPDHISTKIIIKNITKQSWLLFYNSLKNPDNLDDENKILNNADKIIEFVLNNKHNLLFN